MLIKLHNTDSYISLNPKYQAAQRVGSPAADFSKTTDSETTFSTKWPPLFRAEGGQVESTRIAMPSFKPQETVAQPHRQYTSASVRQASRTLALVSISRGGIWFPVTMIYSLVAIHSLIAKNDHD
jgi:hypothetical protein